MQPAILPTPAQQNDSFQLMSLEKIEGRIAVIQKLDALSQDSEQKLRFKLELSNCYLHQGQQFLWQNKQNEATTSFIQSVKYGFEPIEHFIAIATFLYQNGHESFVLSLLAKINQEIPLTVPAWVILADLPFTKTHHTECIKVIELALSQPVFQHVVVPQRKKSNHHYKVIKPNETQQAFSRLIALKAFVLSAQGVADIPTTIAECERALRMDPNNHTASHLLAELTPNERKRKELTARSLSQFNNAPGNHVAKDEDLFFRAGHLFILEKWAETESLYLQLLDHPNYGQDAIEKLFKIALKRKNFSTAFKWASQFAKKWPSQKNASSHLCEAYTLLRQQKESKLEQQVDIAFVEIASGTLPHCVDVKDKINVRTILAATCMKLEKYNDAKTHLIEISKLSPTDSENWNNLGQVYAQLNEWEAAHEAFFKVCELKSNDPTAWAKRARVLIKLGRKEEARVDYELICILKQTNPIDEAIYLEALLFRARFRFEEKKFSAAYMIINRALRLSPKDITLLNTYKDIMFSRGKAEIVLSKLRHYVKEQPKNSKMRILLASALIEAKLHDEAIEHLLILHNENKNDTIILLELSRQYTLNGKTALAIAYASKALEIEPNAMDVIEQLKACQNK